MWVQHKHMQQLITEMAPPVARQNLPTGNLMPNDYNPNVMDEENRKRLLEFIKEVKRVPSDLWVRCVDQVGADHSKHKHEIIDGFNRWDIARQLDLRAVPCEIYQVSDLTAMGMCYRINKVRGRPLPFQEAAFFYLIFKRLPANQRGTSDVARVVGEPKDYIESRLLLWTISPVAKKLTDPLTLPIAVWEELAKSVRVDADLTYVERAVNIILPNAKDYLPGNVRNLVASLRRQDVKDTAVLRESVSDLERHKEETHLDRMPKPKPAPKGKTPEPPKGRAERRPESKASQAQPEPPKPAEPKPTMVFNSACYICGAEDEIVIWTKSGTDKDILKVVNRAKLKSFEKNLVQERANKASEVSRERVLLSK